MKELHTNEGTILALSELMNFSQVAKEIKGAEEINEVECAEATIPEVNNHEIVIDQEMIISSLSHNNTIAQCTECRNNLEDAEVLHFIQNATKIVEMRFTDICHETKISEKIIKVLENECFLSCRSQCTHFKIIVLTTIAHEFIKAWCIFINKILCRKIQTYSDNVMYNAAKKMSTKYVRKDNEYKPV